MGIIFFVTLTGCKTSPKTDLRSFAPLESLAYLETKDVSKLQSALTQNVAWKELADTDKIKLPLNNSFLDNIQIAVVLMKTEIGNDAESLNLKPHFVVIAENNSFGVQTQTATENLVSLIAKKSFGDNFKQEKQDKNGVSWTTWKPADDDSRKIFAVVLDNLAFVSNDQESLEICLAVKRGEHESLLKRESVNELQKRVTSADTITFGYVSPEGVKQLAGLYALSASLQASENPVTQSFIRKILPDISAKTVKEIAWTTRFENGRIEDKFLLSVPEKITFALRAPFAPRDEKDFQFAEFLPNDVFSATRYNLKNPRLAWRGMILAIANQTDSVGTNLINSASENFLAPYGIKNPEQFLSAIDGEIVTLRLDEDGEESAAIVGVKDEARLKDSLATEDEKILQVVDKTMIIGNESAVAKCLQAYQTKQTLTVSQNESSYLSTTFSHEDSESLKNIITNFAETKNAKSDFPLIVTETRLTDEGFERKTVSSFGMIGQILNLVSGE